MGILIRFWRVNKDSRTSSEEKGPAGEDKGFGGLKFVTGSGEIVGCNGFGTFGWNGRGGVMKDDG